MAKKDNDLTYVQAVETWMVKLISEHKQREQHILKDMGIPKLPEELERLIASRSAMEGMLQAMLERPKSAKIAADIFVASLTASAEAKKEKREREGSS